MGNEPDASPFMRLSLTFETAQLGEFFPWLQQGVTVIARTGGSVVELLTEQLGMDDAYVRERITTVFLDSKAVDDIDTAHVREGSTIALSAAMPGLVGATMRRGGYYAAMRGTITHAETDVAVPDTISTIRIKLFNLLLPEFGPELLRRGIVLGSAELTDFFSGKPASFWRGCGAAHLDGSPVEPEMLRTGNCFSGGGKVLLSVTFLPLAI